MARTKVVFQHGDSVEVKRGVRIPDYETLCIDGWRGRVVEVDYRGGKPSGVNIEWDSVTLRCMPRKYIEECAGDGDFYREMALSVDDVLPVKPRDTAKDVEEAQNEIAESVSRPAQSEEVRRIQRVLEGVDEADELAVFKALETHLRHVLSLPFDAEVTNSETGWLIKYGDRLTVTGIAEVDDTYGVIVDVIRGDEPLQFPLCNLKVLDRSSSNWERVHDHAVWFADRLR